jgi:DNA-binding MarR family transcriptional regulator
MPDTVGAHRELLDQLRDMLKAVRLFKQQAPPTAIPAGMVGVLVAIDTIGATGRPQDDRPGCHGKDLAAHNALDPSTVSRSVAALVRLGLVRRYADPADGRASLLALTARGRAALDETHRWYDDLLAGALDDWTPQELADFAAMLHRFSTDVLSHVNPRTTHTLEAAR